MKAKWINLTRGSEIGANSYYMEFEETGVLLDAGMHPKLEGYAALPQYDLLKKKNVQAVFITHAHHDHIGSLPLLMQKFPDARVFMAEETYFMADPLLRNSVSVMKKQKKELGIAEYPLYTNPDITKAAQQWQACRLNQPWSLKGYPLSGRDKKDDLYFEFHHAGHILGSVAVELIHRGRRILYTGDVNFADQTIMTAAELPEAGIDTLIVETTRGAQANPEGYDRNAVVREFIEAMNETFHRGGAVLIPVFAMGKTQELLTILHYAQKKGDLPKGPIYIGGLSKVFTEIYDQFDAADQLQLLEDVRPEIVSGKKLHDLNPKKGHIYLISSGMMTENTLSNLFAHKILSRENDSIFFVGYTDPESPAGKLRATPRGERVILNKIAGDQPVLCRVQHFDLTAHAVREDTLDYIQRLNPRCCVLVHGDPSAIQWFETQLQAKCPSMQVIVPPPGKEMTL
ncbi:MAG: MBL fold metallo-hydrolase [Verrucomicrobiota bacterium]